MVVVNEDNSNGAHTSQAESSCFRPACWRVVDPRKCACPACGYDLLAYERLPFEQKLLLAVRHPVQDNRLVAIQSLGRMKSAAAVPVFAEILASEESSFVIRKIAYA